jgi:hypothetical protein
MTPENIDFDTVQRIGLTLPGVEIGTAYGLPALKHKGKLLACVPANRSAEPNSIVLRISSEDRAELLAAAPDTYYLTDHYVDHDTVLVRLSRVTRDILRDLLSAAYRFVTEKSPKSPPLKSRRKFTR